MIFSLRDFIGRLLFHFKALGLLYIVGIVGILSVVDTVSANSFSMHSRVTENGDPEINEPLEMFAEGNFRGLVKKYRPRELSDLIPRIDALCSAQLILGEYQAFFNCAQVWENSSPALTAGAYWYREADGIKGSQAKDKYYGKQSPLLQVAWTTYTSAMSAEEADARRNRLLAEAWFQLGNYTKASHHALTAIRQYQLELPLWVGPSSRPDMFYWAAYGGAWIDTYSIEEAFPGGRTDNNWKFDIIITAALAAQSEIKRGNPKVAYDMLYLIDNIHVDKDGNDLIPSFSRLRQTYKNIIYASLGEYDQMTISDKGMDEYLDDALGLGVMAAGGVMIAYGGGQGLDVIDKGYKIIAEDQAEGILMREAFQNAIIANHRHDWNESLDYLDSVLSNENISAFAELKQLALQQKGLVLIKLERPAEALFAFNDAITIIEQRRGNVSTEAQKLGYFGDKNLPYQQSIKLLISQGDDAAAFAMAERARSRTLVDMLADTQARRGQLPESLTTIEPSLLAANDATKSRSTNALSTEETLTLRSRALRRASPKERKEAEAKTLTSVQSYSATDLQALLKPSEILVEYVQLESQWYAFKVTSERVVAIELNLSGLENRIEAYRHQLQEPTNTTYYKEAKALYRDLIVPLKLDTAQVLTIVPSGALNYLPFSTLHDGQQYLIQRQAIKLLPSVTSKAFLQSKKTAPRLLAMGNPTGDLPGAEAEVAVLQRMLKGTTTVKREQASESFLKQKGGRFNMLHIASHGEFNPADPSASRLLLAPDAKNDGDLTMAEIYGLELNVNLVVLSACETGLNEIKNGEEIFGLTRGFLYAGSSNVVASLWKVDDRATKTLMEIFYQGLVHKPYAESLRDAQLSLQQGEFAHPFYWAAFQITGEG